MNELTKNLYCVQMRTGVELWYEQDRVLKLQSVLEGLDKHMFVRIDDRTLNTADVVGIFSASDLEESTRRKQGMWKCKNNKWHGKNDKCDCGHDLPVFVAPETESVVSQATIDEIRSKFVKSL